MTIQADLFSALTGHAGLIALVSSGSPLDHRIYPVRIPQSPTYPLIKYFRVTNNHINSLSGSLNLNQSRYQFDIYAGTQAEAQAVEAQLIAAMAAASTFESILLSSIESDFDDDIENYRLIVDYSVWHR